LKREEPEMKITRIRTRGVDLPLMGEFRPAWARGRNQPNVILVVIEVETDAGITGFGAAHAGAEAAIAIERFVSLRLSLMAGLDPAIQSFPPKSSPFSKLLRRTTVLDMQG
jgi:L-alanine-DL-glutamate epimerase-like enolase superfamily enzyme